MPLIKSLLRADRIAGVSRCLSKVLLKRKRPEPQPPALPNRRTHFHSSGCGTFNTLRRRKSVFINDLKSIVMILQSIVQCFGWRRYINARHFNDSCKENVALLLVNWDLSYGGRTRGLKGVFSLCSFLFPVPFEWFAQAMILQARPCWLLECNTLECSSVALFSLFFWKSQYESQCQVQYNMYH